MAIIREDRGFIENASFEEGNILIVNCVNDSGEVNTENMTRIFDKFPAALTNYKENFSKHFIGDVDFVECGKNEEGQTIYVANAYGFRTMWTVDNSHPIRLEVLRGTFTQIVEFAKEHECTIHFAKWDTDRFGTSWDNVEEIIRKEYASISPIMTMYLNER